MKCFCIAGVWSASKHNARRLLNPDACAAKAFSTRKASLVLVLVQEACALRGVECVGSATPAVSSTLTV